MARVEGDSWIADLMTEYGYSWLESEGQIYWARSAVPFSAETFIPSCHSSLITLVDGLYRLDPRWARKRVRNRIQTNERIYESAWGTIKVAARRASFGEPVPKSFGLQSLEIASPSLEQLLTADSDLDFWMLQRATRVQLQASSQIWSFLEELTNQGKVSLGQRMAHPVSAVLLDSVGFVLSWGVNSAWDFRVEHAETNLIRRWLRAGSPGVPASLWVTRKCCKMCAGWVWDTFLLGGLASLRVHFREPDNGPMARFTVLDQGSYENQRALRDLSVSR
ncbi:MAG: hypothetical protein KGQ59_09575 [Bdellovibrionales bacterium]|nr:hypothetical protein [Bdellovibrionales bacterium]